MNISAFLLKIFGWKIQATAPDLDKCIICVAPHTSNWDFVMGKLAYSSLGRNCSFLIKDTWFVFPFDCFFKALGGIPVPRKKKRKGSLVEYLVNLFNNSKKLQVAITPEGTRSRTSDWRTGFLQIATQANVPCELAAIDYKRKLIVLDEVFYPTGDVDSDLRRIKDYYKSFVGKYPEKFTTE